MACLVDVLLDPHFLPQYTVVLSAKIYVSPEGTENGKSFVHRANSVGPRTDP